MTNERRTDEDIPEHERRAETSAGGGLSGQGGTMPEPADEPRVDEGADRYVLPGAHEARPSDDPDAEDEPADPDGPEVAYTPRSI